MKVAVIGTGYVGLSTGVGLAEIGHDVTCIDIDEAKIGLLKEGRSPIYEPGIEEYIKKNMSVGKLQFTTSLLEGIDGSQVIILAVGTPSLPDGKADLSFLDKAAKDVAQSLKQEAVIAIKSTVPVGTNRKIKSIIENKRKTDIPFHMMANPEFLKEGSALKDTLHPDRIVIGCESEFARKTAYELYKHLKAPILFTTIESAEMIKYASNAFLAMKISFINFIAQLCEKTGGDILDVAHGMGMDPRIGKYFLKAGIGFGGSCFPKDIEALIKTAEDYEIRAELLKETIVINDKQHLLLVDKALQRFASLKGKTIALWGLSFKPNTDDLREAPSLKIVRALHTLGAVIKAYDPVAMARGKEIFGELVHMTESPMAAAEGSDALFLVTEWDEFLNIPLSSVVKRMKEPIIFDGRNAFSEENILSCDQVEYYPVGRKPIIKT